MADEAGTVRSVAWGEIFPWLMIFRALRLSISIPMLFLATLGTLLMPLGWWGAGFVMPAGGRAVAAAAISDPLAQAIVVPPKGEISSPTISVSWRVGDLFNPMLTAVACLVAPLRQLLRYEIGWSEFCYYGLGGLWNLLVWGFFGGAITRIAVMRLGREEREGLLDACRFVRRRLLAFVGAPLFALSGIAIVAALVTPVGWLMRWDVGVLLASLLWVLVLVGGLTFAIIVLGLLLGWPLMWGALSAEEMGDVFEGTQRSYSYVFGRPLHYAFYMLITLVAGSIMYYVASAFAQLTVYGSCWAVSWGSGLEVWSGGGVEDSGPALLGMSMIASLNALVLSVAAAFRYSFLWCAAGAAYLLLRRDSDQIEFDNVYLEDEPTRYGLPPLTIDAAGVPGVDVEGQG